MRDVDEDLEVALVARDVSLFAYDGSRRGRGFEVTGRDAHAEIDPPATGHGPLDVDGAGEVADDDLGAELAEGGGAIVFAMDHGPIQISLAKELNNRAADATDAAGGTRDQNRTTGGHSGCSLVGASSILRAAQDDRQNRAAFNHPPAAQLRQIQLAGAERRPEAARSRYFADRGGLRNPVRRPRQLRVRSTARPSAGRTDPR